MPAWAAARAPSSLPGEYQVTRRAGPMSSRPPDAERAARSAVEDDSFLRGPAGGDLGAGDGPGEAPAQGGMEDLDQVLVLTDRQEPALRIAHGPILEQLL